MTAAPEVIAAAKDYIGQGHAIVAVRPDKKPWGDDPEGKNWRRKFTETEILARLAGPRCVAIGYLGGSLNNNIVPLDFDTDEGEAWWREQCEAEGIDPDDFPTVITPGKVKDGKRSPGKHRYVSDVRGALDNAEGTLKPLGINVRGNGHAMLPPSPHPDGGTYRWMARHSLENFETIPACPDFIYEAVEAPKQHSNGTAQPIGNVHIPDDGTRKYCRAALDGERQRLAQQPSGQRNTALNNAGLALGSLAHYGAYSEGEAREALRAACDGNGLIGDKGLRAFEATFQSGWKAGLASRREIKGRDNARAKSGKSTSTPVEVAVSDNPAKASDFTIPLWLKRTLAEPDFLLGDLFSTTSRVMMVGPTGSGKTNLAMAMNFSMAAGNDFLHWNSRRAARLIYFDGEMSARLARERLRQAVHRHGYAPDNLIFINRDDFPAMPPLDSEEGQQFVNHLIEQAGGVDFATFDNVQSALPISSGGVADPVRDLWSTASHALRVIQEMAWVKRRAGAVAFIDGATW